MLASLLYSDIPSTALSLGLGTWFFVCPWCSMPGKKFWPWFPQVFAQEHLWEIATRLSTPPAASIVVNLISHIAFLFSFSSTSICWLIVLVNFTQLRNFTQCNNLRRESLNWRIAQTVVTYRPVFKELPWLLVNIVGNATHEQAVLGCMEKLAKHKQEEANQ